MTLFSIMKILVFPLRERRKIKENLCNYSSKQIIWLHSAKKVKGFLAQLEQDMGEKTHSSSTVTVANKRPLVTAGR
jgi:hypothetical protein